MRWHALIKAENMSVRIVARVTLDGFVLQGCLALIAIFLVVIDVKTGAPINSEMEIFGCLN